MKTLNKIFLSLGVVAATFTFSSCTGDLDQLPTDPNSLTNADFASDPDKYMDETMAGVYQQFTVHGANNNSAVSGFDGGMSTFQRSAFILEELNSDEATWLPNDADYGTFQYGIVPANNRVILGTYSRFTVCVSMCNSFIQTVNGGYFGSLNDAQKAKAEEYVRQCRVLRAGAYFYLIDCFGNVPYADESVLMGSIAPQLKRAEVYAKVVEDLEAVSVEYGNNTTVEYGQVGKDVADALLVKFYLNAEVYTGKAEWAKCTAKAEEIIARHKGTGFKESGLAKNYSALFGANNDKYCAGGSSDVNEIIWCIPQDATYATSWANSTFMIDAWIGEPKDGAAWNCRKAWYNAGDAWKCMTARRQFVEKFDWNEDYTESPDSRLRFWCHGAHGFNINNDILDQDHFGDNGFLAVKYSNWAFDEDGNIDEANSPAATTQVGADYAVIRLAEIYLSAAEAILNGGGDKAKALEYVNYIRERAGLNAWNAGDLTAVSLQDERCRELYTENVRRSDLIRYGKWISGYTWNWKNNVKGGADFNSNFTLYPLPSSTVELAHYDQNTGY
ncbi:MAG: RagB/SusD family nutrient uptake outer membrane protein [Muribaculaceae bacterium]